MAKQTGLYHIRGKVGDYKYYGMKGVDGTIMAKQNEGMSERVKNDAAYANTRLNNAEFGAAASTSGAFTRIMSKRWRYLLVPFAGGKLSAFIRKNMLLDTTNPWGQRSLQGVDWQKEVASHLCDLAKIKYGEISGLDLTAQLSADGMTVTRTLNGLYFPLAEAKGCTGIRITLFTANVDASKFDGGLGGYAPALSNINVYANVDAPIGTVTTGDTYTDENIVATAQASDKFYGAGAIFEPYREVNGEKYIMQEFCSFGIIAAKPAA